MSGFLRKEFCSRESTTPDKDTKDVLYRRGLNPTYSVAMPNVSGYHFTSASPCPRSFSARASPSGNSS
jgi:hypothetical protein